MNMKKRNAVILASALMTGVIGIGSTLAYFTESDSKTNVFTLGDLDIGLEEPEWNPGGNDQDGKNMYPGYTVYKNPTIKNLTSDEDGEEPCYARIKVEIQDNNGNLIDDQAALDLIYKTIYYDYTYTGTYSEKGTAQGLVEDRIPGYSLSDLASYPMVNPVFKKDEVRSTASTLVFNYMGTSGNGILNIGDEATLFTNVVIPTDWNQTHFDTIEDFQLKVTAECIQSNGFATQADAYTALDKEIEQGNLQEIDRSAN